MTAVLERPQPIGWGLDPALESVAEAYMLNAAELDVAVSQLVCLREAFERCVVARVASDQLDVARRLTMILQRLTTVVVRAGVQRLQGRAACSVGIATYPPDPIDELVTRADWRLYEGRSRRATSADHGSRTDPESLAIGGADVFLDL